MYWQALAPAATLLVITVTSAPGAETSNAATTMPASVARFTAGAIALASTALSMMMSTPDGDEVVDLRDLLVEVVVGRDRGDLDVRVDLLGAVLDALDRGDEERIAEQADRDADAFEILGGGCAA